MVHLRPRFELVPEVLLYPFQIEQARKDRWSLRTLPVCIYTQASAEALLAFANAH